jgi:hypothetical protein
MVAARDPNGQGFILRPRLSPAEAASGNICGDTSFVGSMRDIVRLEPEGRFSINMDYFSHDKYGMLKPFKPRFIETFGPPHAW